MLKQKITVMDLDDTVEHILAFVHWYKKHPEQMYFGSSAHVLRNDFELGGTICYIHIQRFNSRMCYGNIKINPSAATAEDVSVAIPIPVKFCA